MSDAIDNLQAALQRALAGRPAVGGFPYLAETLRRAGVTRNLWFLPACQSLYLTEKGSVVSQGMPLISGTVDVPPFDREALITALRTDQAGKSTFPVLPTCGITLPSAAKFKPAFGFALGSRSFSLDFFPRAGTFLVAFFTVVYPLSGLIGEMTQANSFNNLVEVGLLIYLFAAMLRPEKF